MKVSSQTLTLVAMCLALAAAALDDTVVNVALPSLQANLDMSVAGLQWILNAYLLPIACLVLPAGRLGDLYGRRRVFLAGLLGFVGASVLVGFSAGGQMAIAGRLLQGIGAAALLPTSLAILSDAFPDPKERTKAIGLWSGVSGLALIVGPALGGLLVDTLGWRSIFFLNVPLGIGAGWLTCQAVPAGSNGQRAWRQRTSQLDLPGMALSVVMLAAFVMLLMGGPAAGGLGLGLLSSGSAAAFIAVERLSAWPMLPLKLFRQPTFTAAIAANALLFFMLVSLLFLFSLFLQQVQGYSAAAAGLRFLPLNGAFIVASVVSGYCSARLGWRCTIAAGFLLAGVAGLSLAQVQADTPFSAMLGQLLLVGFGVGFALSPLTAAGMGSLPPAQSGIAAALMNTSTRLGGALGVAVQGGIFARFMGADLGRSLAATDLNLEVRQAIVAEALSHGATRPARLMASLSDSAATLSFDDLEMAIQQAFIAGLHRVVQAGAIALFVAAGLSVIYVRSRNIAPAQLTIKPTL